MGQITSNTFMMSLKIKINKLKLSLKAQPLHFPALDDLEDLPEVQVLLLYTSIITSSMDNGPINI